MKKSEDKPENKCSRCYRDTDSFYTAYLPQRKKEENLCKACAKKVETAALNQFVQDKVAALCSEFNGGSTKKVGKAMSVFLQREHRYLQGEFFQMLFHMFADYKDAQFDDRNEYAVKYADRCYKAISPKKENDQ